jgi:hypothetical protein
MYIFQLLQILRLIRGAETEDRSCFSTHACS